MEKNPPTQTNVTVYRSWAVIFVLVTILVGWWLLNVQRDAGNERKFRFGLDLVGGSHLVYEADTSHLDPAEVDDAMMALRDVIETRVNLFGVSEPLVQVEKASALSEGDKTERLIVELPGVTDLQEAVEMIGATPQLEFKIVGDPVGTSTEVVYIETGLTGQLLKRARLEFSSSQGCLLYTSRCV